MSLMAICARYGNVQPSEFDDLEFNVARELAERLVKLHRDEVESNQKLHLELTKALMKAQGARVM